MGQDYSKCDISVPNADKTGDVLASALLAAVKLHRGISQDVKQQPLTSGLMRATDIAINPQYEDDRIPEVEPPVSKVISAACLTYST